MNDSGLGPRPRADAHASRLTDMHVVPPSWQPLLLAIGITLALAGVALTPIVWIIGLVLSIASIAHWMTELRRDFHPAGRDDSGLLE